MAATGETLSANNGDNPLAGNKRKKVMGPEAIGGLTDAMLGIAKSLQVSPTSKMKKQALLWANSRGCWSPPQKKRIICHLYRDKDSALLLHSLGEDHQRLSRTSLRRR